MTTVAALSRPMLGAVQLTVTPTAGQAVSAVQRTDVNGTRNVRTVAGLLPATAQVVLLDYEAALTGQVTYRAITAADTGQASVSGIGGGPWLFLPEFPAQAVLLDLVSSYDSDQPTWTTVHDVAGRASALATMGPLRSRRGTFEVWCADYPAAAEVADLYGQSRVALLRTAEQPGMDTYHVATSVRITPYTRQRAASRWSVRVGFAEVDPPAGPVVGTLGWTYADVAADYTTYAELVGVFADYAALQIGPDPWAPEEEVSGGGG